MFKWFAPLLLFAGKPEVLIRLLVGVLAGAVLFFGVWLISNIALTFDTLKNPYIAAAYGAVLLLFFVVVGTVAWLRSAPADGAGKARAATRRAGSAAAADRDRQQAGQRTLRQMGR